MAARAERLSKRFIIIILIICAVVMAGCGDKKPAPNTASPAEQAAAGPPKAIKSSDNKLELTAPGSWQTETTLNSDARIQIADRTNEQALFLVAENKQDLQAAGINLEGYAEEGYKPIAAQITNAKVTGPNKVTINNSPAIQYQIEGPPTGQSKSQLFTGPLVYLYTVVEGKTDYQQIIAWTTAARWEKNRPELQQLVQSLKSTE